MYSTGKKKITWYGVQWLSSVNYWAGKFIYNQKAVEEKEDIRIKKVLLLLSIICRWEFTKKYFILELTGYCLSLFRKGTQKANVPQMLLDKFFLHKTVLNTQKNHTTVCCSFKKEIMYLSVVSLLLKVKIICICKYTMRWENEVFIHNMNTRHDKNRKRYCVLIYYIPK